MIGADIYYGGEKIGSLDDYVRINEMGVEIKSNVNSPKHYTYGKYECIDVIKDITEGNEAKGIEAFCLGNVLKYLWRYKHKNGTEDLKKAMWYLERLIKENEINDTGDSIKEH